MQYSAVTAAMPPRARHRASAFPIETSDRVRPRQFLRLPDRRSTAPRWRPASKSPSPAPAPRRRCRSQARTGMRPSLSQRQQCAGQQAAAPGVVMVSGRVCRVSRIVVSSITALGILRFPCSGSGRSGCSCIRSGRPAIAGRHQRCHSSVMQARPNVIVDAIRPPQLRAARALLGWSQDQLSDASSIPKRTIARLELGEVTPQRRTVDTLRATLESAGVEFIAENGGGPGVRLARR